MDKRPPPLPRRSTGRAVARVAAACVAAGAAIAGALAWTFALDTHHETRDSIWWNDRCRNLIPEAATDITLQRDLLDHRAVYTIREEQLVAFLNERFDVADAYAERRRMDPAKIGQPIGELGWVVTPGSVYYGYAASNGGVSNYYHDPVSGRTYQDSAHW